MSEFNKPVIMMRLDIRFDNGTRQFIKEAFDLPASFHWHRGLWINDPADEGGFRVEAVYVASDGSGTIVFEERFEQPMEEVAVTEWTNFGWALRGSQHE